MKALVFIFTLFTTIYFAQSPNLKQNNHNSSFLNGNDGYPKHSVDLRFSMWRNTSSDVAVKFTGVSIDVGGDNTGGRIMYNYYPNKFYAFNFSVGVLSAQVNVNTTSSYTSTILPIMIGAKYFLISEDISRELKYYL